MGSQASQAGHVDESEQLRKEPASPLPTDFETASGFAASMPSSLVQSAPRDFLHHPPPAPPQFTGELSRLDDETPVGTDDSDEEGDMVTSEEDSEPDALSPASTKKLQDAKNSAPSQRAQSPKVKPLRPASSERSGEQVTASRTSSSPKNKEVSRKDRKKSPRNGKESNKSKKSREGSIPTERSRAAKEENKGSKTASKESTKQKPREQGESQKVKLDAFGRVQAQTSVFLAIDAQVNMSSYKLKLAQMANEAEMTQTFESNVTQSFELQSSSATSRATTSFESKATVASNSEKFASIGRTWSGLSTGMAKVKSILPLSSKFETPENAVIIFDWDDTLCPTWFLSQGTPEEIAERVQDKLYQELLREHAMTVEAVIRTAASLARVAIVTLATAAWFHKSMMYFPGVDMAGLLSELGIVTHYATVPSTTVAKQSPFVLAKKVCMATILQQFYGKSAFGPRWNVISIGDKDVEARALEALIKESWHHRLRPLCKTVKLRENPDVFELTDQLKELLPLLPSMVTGSKDFHRNLGRSAQLRMISK